MSKFDKRADGMKKELGQVQKEAWGALLVAHAALTRRMYKILVQEGFPSLQVYDVLLALEDAPNQRLRMSDLATYLVFDASSLTRLVDRLEKLGYVTRAAHPTDRRSVFACITEKGLQARIGAWPRYRELIQENFGQFLSDRLAGEVREAFTRARSLDGAAQWRRPDPNYSREKSQE